MRRSQFTGIVIVILAIVALTLNLASSAAAANTFTVLHAFTWAGGPQGLMMDSSGNLYGTTLGGGAYGGGVVYKLAPQPGGTWAVSILHSFAGRDGLNPASGVILDSSGNLYGTTLYGGVNGMGVVFRLKPNLNGTWTESVLHSFAGSDGHLPVGGVTLGVDGNLYGTTEIGGGAGVGLVFKLEPTSGATWNETVLYSFTGLTDGSVPEGGVTFDAAGNLYGTTAVGGKNFCDGAFHQGRCGVVFELSPNPDGTWTEHVLHYFSGDDGEFPGGALIFDAAGSLYGATYEGGGSGCAGGGDQNPNIGCGVVYKLAPNSDGTWTHSVLHRFNGGSNGNGPGWLAFDTVGNLYGATSAGGGCGFGLVFKLTASTNWTATVLHTFVGYGRYPSSIVLDSVGNVYGTSGSGSNNGLVFQITP